MDGTPATNIDCDHDYALVLLKAIPSTLRTFFAKCGNNSHFGTLMYVFVLLEGLLLLENHQRLVENISLDMEVESSLY